MKNGHVPRRCKAVSSSALFARRRRPTGTGMAGAGWCGEETYWGGRGTLQPEPCETGRRSEHETSTGPRAAREPPQHCPWFQQQSGLVPKQEDVDHTECYVGPRKRANVKVERHAKTTVLCLPCMKGSAGVQKNATFTRVRSNVLFGGDPMAVDMA